MGSLPMKCWRASFATNFTSFHESMAQIRIFSIIGGWGVCGHRTHPNLPLFIEMIPKFVQFVKFVADFHTQSVANTQQGDHRVMAGG